MVKMKFVLFAFALLPATALCATLNLLELTPEDAQRWMAAQNQELTFAKKISSFPLPEPVLERSGDSEHLRGVEYYNGQPIKNYADFYEDNYEASQYHGQDGLGRYLFGFSAPNHARVEERNQEGVVRGSYQYIGPYDEPIKVEYWADKDGFHQTDNLGLVGPQPVEETPEVKEARLEHERLWKEAAEKASAQPDPLSDEYNKMALAYDATQEKVDHETEYNKPSDEMTRYPKLPYSEHIKPDTTGNPQEGIVIENASMKSSEMGQPKGFFYSFDYPVRAILRKPISQEVLNEEYAKGKLPFPQLPPSVTNSILSSSASSAKTTELHPHFRNTATNIEAEAPQESIVVEKVQPQNSVIDKFVKKSQTSTEKPVEIQVPVQIVPVPIVVDRLGGLEITHEKEHVSEEPEKMGQESTGTEKDSTEEASSSTTDSTAEDQKDETTPSEDDTVEINVSTEQDETVKSGMRFDDTTDKSDGTVDKDDVTTAKSDSTAADSESSSNESDDGDKSNEEAAKIDDIADRFGAADDKSDDNDKSAEMTDKSNEVVDEQSDNVADKSDDTTFDKSTDKSDESTEEQEVIADKFDQSTVKSDGSTDALETTTGKTEEVNDIIIKFDETLDKSEDIASKADDTTDKTDETTDQSDEGIDKADDTEMGMEEELKLDASSDSAKQIEDMEETSKEIENVEESQETRESYSTDFDQSQEHTTAIDESSETYDKSTENISTDGTLRPTLKESEENSDVTPPEESKRVEVTAELHAESDDKEDEKKEEIKAGDKKEEEMEKVESDTTPEDKLESTVKPDQEKENEFRDRSKQDIVSMLEELADVANNEGIVADANARQVRAQALAKADTLINAMKEYFAEQDVEPLDETPEIVVNDMADSTEQKEDALMSEMDYEREKLVNEMRSHPKAGPMAMYDMQLSKEGDGVSYSMVPASQEIK